MTCRFVIMRSGEIKNPLPRANVFSFESNVSIATADGLMRFTNSGKKSCALILPAKHAKNTKRKKKVFDDLEIITTTVRIVIICSFVDSNKLFKMKF